MAVTPANSERPLRRDAERNRQRILEAAREAFAEDGLSVTLDEIARRAGVGVGTIYRRFPDKEQLIDALFETRMNEFAAEAEAALLADDPWAGLVRFLERATEQHACDRGFKEVALSGAHGLERVARARQLMFPLVSAARRPRPGRRQPARRRRADRHAAAAAHARLAERVHARRRSRGLAALPRHHHRRPAHAPRRADPARARRALARADAEHDAHVAALRALPRGDGLAPS